MTTKPVTAEDFAEAMYAAGQLSPDQPAKADIAIPTAEPRSGSRYIPDDRPPQHGLPNPPFQGPPPWAMKEPPERDPAGAEIFAEDYGRADRFWAWLIGTRKACAIRAQRGHAYLSTQAKPDADDIALYRALLRWVAWCDMALWLLTAWYSPHHAGALPHSLVLPFAGYVAADGDGANVVREINGLPGNWLIEDVLADWLAIAESSGYLINVEEED